MIVGSYFVYNMLSNNYYCGETNGINTNGATRVFSVTLPEGVTSSNLLTFGGKSYAKSGEVTFSYLGDTYKYNVMSDVTVTFKDNRFYANDTDLGAVFPATLEGNGSENNPFLIKTEENLRKLATYVNNGNDCAGINFKLANDIKLTSDWTAIGNSSNKFKGTFDGDGKTVSNLTISDGGRNQGLFGYTDDATIKNVNLTDVKVTGWSNVGSLVGYASEKTQILNCFASGSVKVTALGANVGGLVGYINDDTTIDSCAFSGNVEDLVDFERSKYSAFASNVGGLVGVGKGTIKNSAFLGGSIDGTAEGAIAGYNTGTLTDNYYYGTLAEGVNNNGATRIFRLLAPDNVTSSALVEFNGTKYITAGEVTFNYNGNTYNYTVTDDLAVIVEGNNLSFEKIAVIDNFLSTLDGDGSENNPYLIKTEKQFTLLAGYVNYGNDCAGKNFKLANDIKLTSEWTPVGNVSNKFKGTFDGDGKTVSNLTISDDTNDNKGLFGYTEDAAIKNINLTSVNVTGKNNVGALVGSATGKTQISNCTVSGNVKGSENVGGFVGINNGTIQKSTYFGGSIDGTNKSVIAGNNTGTLTDNYYYGTLAGGVNSNGATQIFNVTLPEGVTSSALVTINGTKYIKSGNITFDYSGKKYSYNVTGDVTVTLQDSKIFINNSETEADFPGNLEGDGSKNNPYLIKSEEQLRKLATYVNKGNNCAGINFKLANDIKLTSNWTPVGTNSNKFKGTFDGDSHTISNLTVNNSDEKNYQGLFGSVEDATIKNVNLTNVNITGHYRAGSLVGDAEGTTQILNCSAQGNVKSDKLLSFVGGLVGKVSNNTTVDGCSFSGNTFGTVCGGVIGVGDGTIKNNAFLGGKKYIKGGDVTFNYNGTAYKYKVSDDVTVTLKDNKFYANDTDLGIAASDSNSKGYATFTIKNSEVSYTTDISESDIKDAYQFDATTSSLTLKDTLKDYVVTVNNENFSAKVNWHYGSATLNNGSTLKYQLADKKNNVTLTSNSHGDKITFDNNSSANITATEGAQINIGANKLTVNNLSINSSNGAGTISVTADGLSLEGYGVQFGNLEIAMESYFRKLTPIVAAYNSADKSYSINNGAQVKTLSSDFTKITLALGNDRQARYKINDKEFLVASNADNLNVVEANGSTFKIQGKEIDTAKIGRITLGEQITFSGTEIYFNGVKTTYAQNKPVIYSLDGKTISISDAATIATSGETKTFKCEAGSYVINGKSFETSADLTFTADANQIKIPLNDAKTEIYFDGVKVSGVANGGEIVFDLSNDKISIPSGAALNITSPKEIKLNLAAGNFTIDGKKISTDAELEITADRDNVKVPMSKNPVTINGAKITGNGSTTIDNTNENFYSILLPDGALVENVSDNTFELAGKNSSAYFGGTNKKVRLNESGTAYIQFAKENSIDVGFNRLMFEQVEIQGNDSWTVETSGTSGIDKITGITNGATISTSAEYVAAGDLRFEVETEGAGEFTICGQNFTSTGDAKNIYVVSGNSNDEIKVVPQAEEFKDDDSEAAGKIYQFDAAGDYTINGITFHATENSKAQTITRGVEFDLSTGNFEYDGLTLEGSGTAQINRYNASLISLTDGAKVNSSDESKYQNRQFEINGAVELIGKKFETNEQIRCGLINIQDTIDNTPVTLKGFVVDDKYVQIQSDCYDSVKIVDKKISSIEGVKASAEIYGNSLANVSIVTTGSGEFSISGKTYKISDDSNGVTFVTDSHGNVAEINGLAGSVEGNFENEISVNGKAIQITGASSVKVTSDGTNVSEISNVAGDSDGTYRKNVRVYKLGGAEKLTTSADGTIILFSSWTQVARFAKSLPIVFIFTRTQIFT